MSDEQQVLKGHTVEILSVIGGKSQGVPMALVEMRPNPQQALLERDLAPILLMFNQEQCIRLRDTFNELLNDSKSWLFVSKQDQRQVQNLP
jgi:hypothetical protein